MATADLATVWLRRSLLALVPALRSAAISDAGRRAGLGHNQLEAAAVTLERLAASLGWGA